MPLPQQEEVKERQVDAQQGRLERQPGRTMMESFEFVINQILNKVTKLYFAAFPLLHEPANANSSFSQARNDAGNSAVESLKRTNNFKAMVVAGSKGSSLNISQVLACVGQQNVEGKRIPFSFR